MSALIVVRHSERLDEVDKAAWREYLRAEESRGCRAHCRSDPIISPTTGVVYASEAASTLKAMPECNQPVKLYASKLRRAAQTAAVIARELGVPVHLSAGLAQIVPDVKKAKGNFEFADIAELEMLCGGVTFIDCDDRSSPEFLHAGNWRRATAKILLNSVGTVPIIVGHRETIRKLAGKHMDTPYCCIGLFEFSLPSEETENRKETKFTESEHEAKIEGSSEKVNPEDAEMTKMAPAKMSNTTAPAKAINVNSSGMLVDSMGRPVRRCGTDVPKNSGRETGRGRGERGGRVGRGGGIGAGGGRGVGSGRGRDDMGSVGREGGLQDSALVVLERLRVITLLDSRGSVVAQDNTCRLYH